MRVKVVLYALWFLLITFVVPAHAGPVVGAIMAVGKAISAFAASSWIGGFIVGIGKSLVVGLLQMAIGKLTAKKAPKQEPVGIVLDVQAGDDLPLSFIVGSRATAGKLKYRATHGSEGDTPNAYMTDVLEIGSLPSYAGPQGIVSLWAGEEKCTILWDEPHPDGRGWPIQQFRKDGKDYLWVSYLDGSQTTANPYLLAKFSGHPERPFYPTMIGRGKQALIVTARFNTDLFSGGAPQMLVEPAPLRFYDLRKDSSAGGFGGHRWDNPATWEPSHNNAIIIYNIVRGISDQRGQWVYGGQNVSAARLPASSWMAAANECDRIVDGRPQYRCGAEISVADEPLDVIDQLRLGCNGRFILSDGIVDFLVGAPAAPVWYFTDAMVIVSDDSELDPWPSLSDTHNTITASYPDPESRWSMKDAPEYSVAGYVADDGRLLTHPLAFRAVPYAAQVQALQKTINEDGRRFRIHELTLPPIARLLKPGNVISWTSARNGYSDKLFIVERITRKRGSLQRAVVKELDPSDYDPPEFYIPPTTGWIGRISAPVQIITGWQVFPATINDDQGRPRRPAIRIKCDGERDGVTHIEVDVRIRDVNQLVMVGAQSRYEAPFEWIIGGDLPANTWLEARGRYISSINTIQMWSDWLPVKTPDILLDGLDVYLDGMVEEINAKRAEYDSWIGQGVRDLIDQAQRNVLLDIEASAEAQIQRQQIRTELGLASSNSLVAVKATQTLTVLVKEQGDDIDAIAQDMTELSIVVDGKASTSAVNLLQSQVTIIGDTITATSNALLALDSEVEKFSASGRFRVYTAATSAGAQATIGLSVAAGDDQATSTAALYLDAVAGGKSRVLIHADQFAVLNDSAANYPFVIEDGAVRMNVAHIGDVLGGSLNINNRFIVARDGSVLIRNSLAGQRTELTNGLLQVFDAANVLRVRLGVW